MHTRIRFQGLRRRSLLVVLVVVLMMSLLPTAAFASSGGRNRHQRFVPQHQKFNRHQQFDRHQQFNRSKPQHTNRNVRCTTTYRVRRGDTLSEIARHNRVSVRELTKTNRIGNPNRIFAGSTLCIPH